MAHEAGRRLKAGDRLEAGALVGEMGTPAENGGWAPHLHFQMSTDTNLTATEIIGVEPEGFNGMGSSLAHGSIETMPIGPKSICDGLMSRRPGDAPFAAVKTAGVRGITVDDQSVRSAMRIAFERMKLVLEPSGAASLAALLGGKVDVKGKTVLVVATGGNVSLADFMAHMNHA
jgi:threonine dehydratase